MEQLKETFNSENPIIAMIHFPPTPGSPLYDNEGGVENIYESVYKDASALLNNGIKNVMFCNEGDRPYVQEVGFETPSTMAAVISKVVDDLEIKSFGTDILWDPKAALALGKATGANFVREVFTGVFAGDNGFWDTNCGDSLRYRKAIDGEDLTLLFNINAEFASSIDARSVQKIAKSVVFSSIPDVLCISGGMTGEETGLDKLRKVKEEVGEDVPVFANTGVTVDTVGDILNIADGVVIGSHLKVDGNTWNPVDPKRVKRFMDKVKTIKK